MFNSFRLLALVVLVGIVAMGVIVYFGGPPGALICLGGAVWFAALIYFWSEVFGGGRTHVRGD